MSYDPSSDPTYEPEEQQETGFKLPPAGIQVIQIKNASVDLEFTSSKGNKGARWEFEMSFFQFDKSGDTSCKVWMDNTSQFGATCLYNLWMAIALPYTIPDPTKISKSTSQPRKSFFDALFQKQLDGSLALIPDNLFGKYLLGPAIHTVRCPSCQWSQRVGFKVTAPRCKQKDMSLCYFTEGVQVEPIDGSTFASLDTTSFMPAPPQSLLDLGVSNDAGATQQPPPTQQPGTQAQAPPAPQPPTPIAPDPQATANQVPPQEQTATPPVAGTAPQQPPVQQQGAPVASPQPPVPPQSPQTVESEDDLPF